MRSLIAASLAVGSVGTTALADCYSSFVSPTVHHVRYDYTSQLPGLLSLSLRVTGPGLSATVAQGTSPLRGHYRLQTAEGGSYVFWLVTRYDTAEGERIEETAVYTALQTNELRGTCLQDDSVPAGSGPLRGLAVPAGIRLQVQGWDDTEGRDVSFSVDGELATDRMERDGGAISLSGAGMATLRRYRGKGALFGDGDLILEVLESRIDGEVNLRARALILEDSILTHGPHPGLPGAQVFTTSRTEVVRTEVLGGSLLVDGAQATIRNCVFRHPLNLGPSLSVMPEIADNAFYGSGSVQGGRSDWRLTAPNYFGSAGGAVDTGWLGFQGALSDVPSLGVFNSQGSDRVSPLTDDRPVPWIRVDGRFGQVVLGRNSSPEMNLIRPREGRPTLFAFNLMPDAREVSGARYRLQLDAAEYLPLNPGHVARRDHGNPYSPADPDRTLNFIIPETLKAGTYAAQLWADLTACAGFEPGSPNALLWSEPVVVDPPFGRPLNLAVVAVHIDVPGYITHPEKGNPAKKRPSAVSQVVGRLRADILTHWPVTDDELVIRDLGPYYFEGTTLGTGLARLTSIGFAYTLAAELEELLDVLESTGHHYDMLVAVVPGTTLGAANEGASMRGFRRIAIVDEGSPGAAIHELGHSLGLYHGTEQYDLADGDDGNGNRICTGKGAFVQALTAFNGSRHPAKAFSGSITHYPAVINAEVYDFMGAKEPHWVVPSTLNVVYPALREMLGTKVAAPSTTGREGGMRPMGDEPSRLVRIRGLFEYGPPRHLIRESIQVTGWTASSTPSRVETSDTQLDARVEVLDALGNQVAYYACYTEPTTSLQPGEVLPFGQVFELPAGAALVQVWNTDLSGHKQQLVAIRNIAKQPPIGGTLTATSGVDDLELVWHTPADTLARPVKSQLFLDQGSGWQPVRTPEHTNRVVVPSSSLAGQVRFRLTTASAFATHTADSAVLELPTHPPSVEILRPWADDCHEGPWNLEAQLAGTGTATWYSSRDGWLGHGWRLAGVELSPGLHTLSVVASAAGVSTTGAVSVVSGRPSVADWHVRPEDLRVMPGGTDLRKQAAGMGLVPGRWNSISLRIHNPGATNAVRVQLWDTPRGGVRVALLDTNLTPLAMEDLRVETEILPDQPTHTLEARVTGSGLPDPAPSNDQCLWHLTNRPPVALGTRLKTTPGQAIPIVVNGFDPEMMPLTYRVLGSPSLGRIGDINGREISYTAGDRSGTDRVVFAVADAEGLESEAQVTIHILEPGAPGAPVFLETALSGYRQGRSMEYAIRTGNDPLRFTSWGLPPGLQLDQARGVIAGTPEVAGAQTFTVIAWNEIGATTQALTGWFDSGAPRVTSLGSVAAVAGQPFAFELRSDPMADGYAVSGLPSGLNLAPATGLIHGSTTALGQYELGVVASNRWGNGYQLLQFAVVPAERAQDYFSLRQSLAERPGIQEISNAEATRELDEPFHAGSLQLVGSLWWTWTAPSNGPVSISTEGSDFDTVLAVYTGGDYRQLEVVAANDNFRWETTSLVLLEAVAGTAYQVAVDGTGRGNVRLNLRYHPEPLVTSPVTLMAIAGQPFKHQVEAENPFNQFTIQGLPFGLSASPLGLISGVPRDKGGSWLTITASNAFGDDTLQVHLDVKSAQYPVFACPSHAAAIYGQPFGFEATATHATQGYRAWPLPSGLTLDPVSGRISGTTWAQGIHRVVIDAINDQWEYATTELVINVRLPFDLWAQNYVLPAGKEGPDDDADADGLTNEEERMCGTNPQDPLDRLAAESVQFDSGDISLTWSSVSGHFYRVQSSSAPKGEPWLDGPEVQAKGDTCSWRGGPEDASFWRVQLVP